MPKQTASQTVGPYFAYGLTPDTQQGIRYNGFTGNELTTEATEGEHVVIEGQVLDGEGNPVNDSMIEIWQANAAGRYRHAEDDRADVALDDSFTGFGRTGTDANGMFRFHTVKPGAVPGRGNALQAPHVMVCVFARGMLSHAYTRLYFSDEQAANDADPVLEKVDPARRSTLIAQRTEALGRVVYRLDIRLQGAGETVFFDV